MKVKCLGADQAFRRRQGEWRSGGVCGGDGGWCGGHRVRRPGQWRNPVFIQYAGQVLEPGRSLLNIKRQPPEVFLPF